MKKRLFIRVSNADWNKANLQNVPYTRMEDLAITYHVAIKEQDDIAGSIIVTNKLMEHWKISKEFLHWDAMDNSARLYPILVEPLKNAMEETKESVLQSGISEEEYEAAIEDANFNPMIVVTNKERVLRASVIFYPGLMEIIGRKIGTNYYIIPSSTHEMLLMPEIEGLGPIDKNMAKEVNHMVAPDERLSDHLYYYDIMKNEFRMVK